MSSRRAQLVRRSRRDNLPVLAGALTRLLGGAAFGATLVSLAVAATAACATDDTRGGFHA